MYKKVPKTADRLIMKLSQTRSQATAMCYLQIGFPIMIKATAGGGGRGMRLAQHKDEYISLLRAATQEALGAFGNGAVYLER